MKNNFGLTKKELNIIRKLNTPSKIQDFLNKIPANFENDGKGETCMSPRSVLKEKKCHCIEGAFFAALCLALNGLGKPLVVDMKGNENDLDHVIAVFQDKKTKKWGAISKTNHAVLRYREPIYNNIRELIMSYFHEYTDNKGRKNLRSFSLPVDLISVFGYEWITSEENLWHIHDYLDKVKHFNILNRKQISNLRKADKIEIEIGKVVEWKKKKEKINLERKI
jgi:hypothetical protein